VRQFPGHKGAVRGLAVSRDGEHLVSCGDDCVVRLWQIPGSFVGEATGEDVDVVEACSCAIFAIVLCLCLFSQMICHMLVLILVNVQ
jgi:WD40 repeat protein